MSEHPLDTDGTEGPYDITVDDLIKQLQEFKATQGNQPVVFYWGTTRYGTCHWNGQMSFIPMDKYLMISFY